MTEIDSFIIVAVAALIHASFQLSISVLTLLSSHTIGANRSHRRLIGLTNAFTSGVLLMTVLTLSTLAYVFQNALTPMANELTWVVVCGMLVGLGFAVWIFYYRREQGTALWLPRPLARYLSDRTKATKQTGEAFGLGVSSVIAELLFIVGPLLVSAMVLIRLETAMQLVGVALYSLLSLSPLLVVNAMIGSGHKISRIQRWREENKQFLQFVAGSALVVLGFYIYVDQVLQPAVVAAAGSL